LTQIPAVLAELPDVVLLAFGMNDASGRRTTEEFVKIMQELTHRIQTARPGCAVILVSPMTANPEWTHAQPEMYPAYAAGLKTLTGPERALADVTAVWLGVLQQKPYLCLSGNGLNHPNDFGHRLYAEVVLGTIGGK
jgi:lysophospholipase L1-like esterase